MYNYILPAGLQQEKKTADVPLVCSVNVLMRENVMLSTARPEVWYKHSSTTNNFMPVMVILHSKFKKKLKLILSFGNTQ
jgi:hypothetical protein